jgi:hypothetical protein
MTSEEGVMASITDRATSHTVWDCRWSRPGYRVFRVAERLQPEKVWVCVRRGERCGVCEEECEACPYWEELPAPPTLN